MTSVVFLSKGFLNRFAGFYITSGFFLFFPPFLGVSASSPTARVVYLMCVFVCRVAPFLVLRGISGLLSSTRFSGTFFS